MKTITTYLFLIVCFSSFGQSDTLQRDEYRNAVADSDTVLLNNWNGDYFIMSFKSSLTDSVLYIGYEKGSLVKGIKSGIWYYYQWDFEWNEYYLKYEYLYERDSLQKKIEYSQSGFQFYVETYHRDIAKDIVGFNPDYGTKRYESHKFNYKDTWNHCEIQKWYYPNGEIQKIIQMRRYLTKTPNGTKDSKTPSADYIGNQYYFSNLGELWKIDVFDLDGVFIESISFETKGFYRN